MLFVINPLCIWCNIFLYFFCIDRLVLTKKNELKIIRIRSVKLQKKTKMWLPFSREYHDVDSMIILSFNCSTTFNSVFLQILFNFGRYNFDYDSFSIPVSPTIGIQRSEGNVEVYSLGKKR